MTRRTAGGSGRGRMVALLAVAVVVGGLPILASSAGPNDPSGQAFPGALGVIAHTTGSSFNLDISRIDIDGDAPVNLTAEMTNSNESQPAWSSEGTFIAFVSDLGGDHEIWRMTATGKRKTQLTTNTRTDLESSWFPSDTKIAFRRNGSGSEAHIWVLNLDDNGIFESETQLTAGSSSNIMPAVSPDGKRIAFVSDRDGDDDIYVMKAKPEGSKNKPVKLTKNSVEDLNPDWSPDGKKIVFDSRKDGADEEIAVIRADGRGFKYLTNNNNIADIDPVWSPDGKRIAFERNGGGVARDIFRMRADGTNQFNITDSSAIDANPSWQPR